MICPNCSADATGNFCASCGAPLSPAACASCGATLVPTARFCTQCGTAVGKAGRQPTPRGSSLPWYLAGGILLVLLIILLLPRLTGRDDGVATQPAGPFQQGAAPAGTPPPLTGTPREQADALFNRIMTERENGDTARAKFFTPMGTQAYQNAEPLDDDGLYHLAAIQVVAEDYTGARTTADRILARNNNHLLALAVAGEAAAKSGDDSAARDFYQRFLNAYDAEMARGLQEYRDHAAVMPEYQRLARIATQR
jgi:hypothetical protein